MSMKTIIGLIIGLLFSVPAFAANCILLNTPGAKPVFYDRACLDHYSIHDQTRQMSVRISFGYYDASAKWVETADRHAQLVDKPESGTKGQPDYVAADPQFSNVESAFKTIDAATTSPGKWVLGLIQARFPDLAGMIE